MSGFSQGGSMAFRFNCEKSESIGGLVIGGQAWFDPTLGYYDYTNNNVLKGKAICNPTFKRPFLNVIGNVDNYYGEDASSVISGFVGIENWRNYSTEVLMCTGDVKTKLDFNITFSTGNKATCYNYSSCPLITSTGMNVYCSVNNMGHDGYALQTAIIKAMYRFFPNTIDENNKTFSIDNNNDDAKMNNETSVAKEGQKEKSTTSTTKSKNVCTPYDEEIQCKANKGCEWYIKSGNDGYCYTAGLKLGGGKSKKNINNNNDAPSPGKDDVMSDTDVLNHAMNDGKYVVWKCCWIFVMCVIMTVFL